MSLPDSDMTSKAARIVTRAVQRLYPKELADSTWDNTGLLLDASQFANPKKAPSVLLTVDLTKQVCDEAIKDDRNVIVAYHPFIFRGLKSITPEDPQQQSLLRLVHHGISVYCPHTAIDAAKGGVNDWLADGISENGANQSAREVVEKVSGVKGHDDAGMGRIVQFKEAVPFSELVQKVKKLLDLDTVQVVRPHPPVDKVSSVALCAGSGGSVLRGVEADVYFTGELGHHEMLYLQETGISAIVCGHSNTERGFLATLKKQLEQELQDEYAEIAISQFDKDPIQYV